TKLCRPRNRKSLQPLSRRAVNWPHTRLIWRSPWRASKFTWTPRPIKCWCAILAESYPPATVERTGRNMASVVGVYARAFADVVVGSGLDSTLLLQQLYAIESLLAENIQFRRVMENPSIPGGSKRAVLDAVAQKIGIARQVRNFIAVVTDHRRLPLLTEILKELRQVLNDRMGIADAEIISARELTEEEARFL